MKHLFLTLFTFILSFQLAFGQTLARIPASVKEHSLSLEELQLKLEEFKVSIAGEVDDSECQQNSFNQPTQNATSSNEFNHDYIADLEKNACSQRSYNLDPNQEEAQGAQDCRVYKKEGLIDRLVDETLQAEKNEQIPAPFRLDDPEVREVHQQAEFLLSEVRKYLYDNSIDREERVFLLASYLEGVALQMRDLIVTKRSYMDQDEYQGTYFYEGLLPEFPASLIREGESHYLDMITSGPNPSTSPFNLKVVDKGFGARGLEYIPLDSLSRDIVTLLKAPTNQNYLRALKWMTLQMMVSQNSLYNIIIGDRNNTEIPNSCQSHFNGELPAQIAMKKNEETGDDYIDSLLTSQGLQFDSSNYQFLEYYIDNVDKNPMDEGYSGLFPFEEYRVAKQGVESREWHPSLRPSLDDVTHFETVLQMKLPEATKNYKGEVQVRKANPNGRRPLREKRNMTYAGAKQFDMIISTPSEMENYEVEDEYGYTYTLDAQRQNLSTFMAELMQRKGLLDYRELISNNLKNKLKSQEVKIDFPSLYGSHIWRNWSLGLLSHIFEEKKNADDRDPLVRQVKNFCRVAPGMSTTTKREICGAGSQNPVAHMANLLKDFGETDEYVPLRQMEEKNFKEYYPLLSVIWNFLRDRTDRLPEARPTEYDLLLNQMEASNPWARVRLSYLIALDEMVTAKDGHVGKRVNTRRGKRLTQNSKCFYSQIESRIERLQDAAKELGVDKSFSVNYSDGLLSQKEKDFLWQDTLDTQAEGSSRLFSQEVDGQKTYEVLEDINFQTFLNRESVESYTSSKLPYSLSRDERQEIDDVFNSDEGQLGEFLFELFSLKGKTSEQEALFENYSQENGISSSMMAKVNFLALDSSLKKPLMKRAIREAARDRRDNIQNQLREFCELEPDDHERMKALFYSTTKAQNKINQMAGMNAVPEELLDQIQSMSPQEWSNMWQGLGAGVLTIGAIVFTGVCAGVTGGACLAVSPMIVGAAIGALGLQANLIKSEYALKREGDVYSKQVQYMEDLGFSDHGSSNEISRTWAWTIMEGLFMLPIVGIVGRTAKVGSKMAYVSAQHVMKQSSAATFKESAKSTIAEADVRTARYLLGMDEIGDTKTLQSLASRGDSAKAALRELKELASKQVTDPKLVNETFSSVQKYRELFSSGKITMDQMVAGMSKALKPLRKAIKANSGGVLQREFGQVSVRESQQVIDRRTAEVVSQYFGHNPAALAKLVKSYSGRRLEKATKLMQTVDSKKGIHRIPLLGNAVASFRKLRNQSLIENAAKIKQLEESTEALARNGGDLKTFILNNMDDLTEVFMKVPMRKREMPYLFIIQGAPSIGGRMAGTRVSGLGSIADGIIMRKFFNARARLVYESYKSQAKEVLSLSTHVGSEGSYEAFKAFQFSVQEASSQMSSTESRQLITQYDNVEKEIIDKFARYLKNQGSYNKKLRLKDSRSVHELSTEHLKRIVFNPETLDEKAIGEVLWSSVSTDELFDLADLGQVAHKVVRELADYESVDEFQRFLNALKVSVLERNPGKVEVF